MGRVVQIPTANHNFIYIYVATQNKDHLAAYFCVCVLIHNVDAKPSIYMW